MLSGRASAAGTRGHPSLSQGARSALHPPRPRGKRITVFAYRIPLRLTASISRPSPSQAPQARAPNFKLNATVASQQVGPGQGPGRRPQPTLLLSVWGSSMRMGSDSPEQRHIFSSPDPSGRGHKFQVSTQTTRPGGPPPGPGLAGRCGIQVQFASGPSCARTQTASQV